MHTQVILANTVIQEYGLAPYPKPLIQEYCAYKSLRYGDLVPRGIFPTLGVANVYMHPAVLFTIPTVQLVSIQSCERVHSSQFS